MPLEKGRRHRLKIEWSKDQGMETVRLRWKTPAKERRTSLWSEVADGVDYWFVYGPSLDRVIAGYRRLTGEAPMMPRWAFGLWQSRQRYETQQQSLDVVDGFRSRRIPFDNIVQDWFYWPETEWGSHRFDPARFPDPDGWVRAIHERHARLMISVWPKFYPGTENFEAMRAKGFLYERTLRSGFKDWVGPGYPYAFYDAFTPGARQLFWEQIERAALPPRRRRRGGWTRASPTSCSPCPSSTCSAPPCTRPRWAPGARVLNAYSLVNSQGIYEGQRTGGARPARLRPDPLGLRRPAALRRRDLVGRRHLDLDGAAPADRGRARLLALRASRTGRWTSAASPSRAASPGRTRGPRTPRSGAS